MKGRTALIEPSDFDCSEVKMSCYGPNSCAGIPVPDASEHSHAFSMLLVAIVKSPCHSEPVPAHSFRLASRQCWARQSLRRWDGRPQCAWRVSVMRQEVAAARATLANTTTADHPNTAANAVPRLTLLMSQIAPVIYERKQQFGGVGWASMSATAWGTYFVRFGFRFSRFPMRLIEPGDRAPDGVDLVLAFHEPVSWERPPLIPSSTARKQWQRGGYLRPGCSAALPIRSSRMTRRGTSLARSKCFTSIRWSARATCSRVPRCLGTL